MTEVSRSHRNSAAAIVRPGGLKHHDVRPAARELERAGTIGDRPR